MLPSDFHAVARIWFERGGAMRTLGAPVVRSHTGGRGGGGTLLTDDTRTLLRLYADVRHRVDERVAVEFRDVVSGGPK